MTIGGRSFVTTVQKLGETKGRGYPPRMTYQRAVAELHLMREPRRGIIMKATFAIVLWLISAGSLPVLAAPQHTCPRSTSQDPFFGAWRPGWYGTEGLAVELGADGVWNTTAPGARISVKLAWWSSAFRPGTE